MSTATLTEQQVDRIAAMVAQRLGVDGNAAKSRSDEAPRKPDGAEPLAHGLFPDVDEAVEAATTAFTQLGRATVEIRAKLVAAMRTSMLKESDALAQLAYEETGLGRHEDKIRKNLLVIHKTPGIEALRPEALTGDHGLMLMERAPYGVIGAITPMTNPSSTLICNAIGMVAAGNSVVFNVHPRAKRVGNRTVQLLNKAIVAAGGPANLVTSIADPSIESAQRLMHHPAVRLLVVTGGPGVVREAMQSGKRAICAGPGNPPVVVDETADIAEAGRNIVLGASFDNNIICVDEKEVFVVDAVADDLLKAMANNHAHVIGKADLTRLDRVVFERMGEPRQPGVINKELIGKNAAVILSKLGIRADDKTRLVAAEVPESHPLVWTEQMMPVLPVVRVADAEQGIEYAVRAEQGNGHTAAMYSKHLDHLSTMARRVNCSIFVKNAPCYAGLGEGGEGYASFTIASPTGEGLTDPRSFSRQRRCVLVDHFRIV